MKLIHTSDWHFGMPVSIGSLIPCQRFFLEQMYRLIREEQVEAVICAGDIYDSSVTNAEAIKLFNDAATILCVELGVKFILVAGNHDSAARLASCRELLKGAGMYVTGKLERPVQPVLLDGGKVAVYCLPWFSRDEVVELYPECKEQIRSQEDGVRIVCDHIRAEMDPNCRNIVVSHAFIVGSELSDSDRAARVGFASAVSASVFDGFDYVALGHIHKPQVIAPHIRYSGSPLKYSFGAEEKQEKGVVLVDTDAMEQRFVTMPMLKDRKSFTGTYEELMALEGIEEDYLWMHVTDRYAGLELQADMRRKFHFLLELYGKSLTEEGELSALTVEQLQSMDETAIMVKFMEESFTYTPSEDQLELFRQAVEKTGEEGDLG